ncbi:MAG: hypothetical protein ACKO35_14300 [Planctomycetaceae bacterium]
MQPTRLILTLTLVVTLLTPVHAAPPAPFNPKSKAFTPPKFVPGARPATPRIQPRFVPPQSLGGRGTGPISGGFKPPVSSVKPPVSNLRPPVVNLKPPVTNLKPPVTSFKPPVSSFRPPVTNLRPPVVNLKPPVTNLRPPVTNLRPPVTNLKPPVVNAPPRMVPKDGRWDRGVFPGPAALNAVDRMRDPPVGPIELADSDGDGIPDWREDLVIGIDPGLIGGGAGGGVDPAPPAADPVPPVADAGPTAWDWVAIGLAAAAFADGLADRRGGFSPDSGVVIERPLVQTVPADPIIVHHEVVSATLVPGVETVVISEPVQPVSPTVEDSPAADAATTASTEPLPQLRVGEGFQLPATGLGGSQGRVAVKVGVVILECPVSVWNEAGLAATVPATTLEAATRADLIVALADGSVAAVVPVELLPSRARGTGAVR